MPKERVGQNLKNLFERTEIPTSSPAPAPENPPEHEHHRAPTTPAKKPAKASAPTEARTPGRPRQHSEEMGRVPLDIPVRQIVYLDTIATTIRAHGGPIIKRVDILRAMIDAIEESSLDLTRTNSREEIKAMIAARLEDNRR